tara:strand:- start:1323 stop:1895 length:573 start_codon:yes stop_codon:yes gene_type:complete
VFAVIHKAGEALPDGLASVVAKLDNLAAGKPPSPAELEPFRNAASAKLQEDIQRANLTLGGGIPNSTLLTRDELISGLPATTKITPESVVDIRKLPDCRTVWLEIDSDAAGLQHIYKRREVDFANKGISRDEIPSVVMSALERGKIVGTNGSASVCRITHNGLEQNIAIGVGSNGFIVRANPVSTWKSLP